MPNMAKKPQDPTKPAAIGDIEEKQVQERVAIGAHVAHETIRRERSISRPMPR